MFYSKCDKTKQVIQVIKENPFSSISIYDRHRKNPAFDDLEYGNEPICNRLIEVLRCHGSEAYLSQAMLTFSLIDVAAKHDGESFEEFCTKYMSKYYDETFQLNNIKQSYDDNLMYKKISKFIYSIRCYIVHESSIYFHPMFSASVHKNHDFKIQHDDKWYLVRFNISGVNTSTYGYSDLYMDISIGISTFLSLCLDGFIDYYTGLSHNDKRSLQGRIYSDFDYYTNL